jgi:hypothetical protein
MDSNTKTTEIPASLAVVGGEPEKRLHALVRNAGDVWRAIGPGARFGWRLLFISLAVFFAAAASPAISGQIEEYTGFLVCDFLQESNPRC